jgi:protein TonB
MRFAIVQDNDLVVAARAGSCLSARPKVASCAARPVTVARDRQRHGPPSALGRPGLPLSALAHGLILLALMLVLGLQPPLPEAPVSAGIPLIFEPAAAPARVAEPSQPAAPAAPAPAADAARPPEPAAPAIPPAVTAAEPPPAGAPAAEPPPPDLPLAEPPLRDVPATDATVPMAEPPPRTAPVASPVPKDAAMPAPMDEALPVPPVPPASPPPPRRVAVLRPSAPATPAPHALPAAHAAPSAAAPPAGAPPAGAEMPPAAVTAAATGPLIPARPVAGMASDRPPAYPALARSRGEQGRVLLRVEVSPQGLPLAVSVTESSGYRSLDSAALEAVRAWRFEPATRGGVPVQAVANVPVQFRLID